MTYSVKIATRRFPKLARSLRRIRGNFRGSLSASSSAGRLPKWSAKAFAVFSLMLGTHMSCRTRTVRASESRFLLLVATIGGERPVGMPGVLPAFLHKAMTIAAVSFRSMLLKT